MGKDKKNKKQKIQSLEWKFGHLILKCLVMKASWCFVSWVPGFSNLCINPWSRTALPAQQSVGYYGAQPPPGYYQQQHWPQQPVQVQPPTHQNLGAGSFLMPIKYLFVWVLVWEASPDHGESLATFFSLALLEAIRWCQHHWDLQSLCLQMMMRRRMRMTLAEAAIWLQESSW